MSPMNATENPSNVRAASLDELLKDVVPNFLKPVPKRDTFRDWLDRAGIPRFKQNPTAARGGGVCFYSVPHVEKFLRNRMTGPRRVQSALP